MKRGFGDAPRSRLAARGCLKAVTPLLPLLATDAEPEVRQMAAFALGLIGDVRAADPLATALADPDPVVQGRAAEALGLLTPQARCQRYRRDDRHAHQSGRARGHRA